MASLKLGEGYVELSVDARRYHSEMAAAEAALKRIGQAARSMPKVRPPDLTAATKSLDAYARAAGRVAKAAGSMASSLASARTAMPSALASFASRIGSAVAAFRGAARGGKGGGGGGIGAGGMGPPLPGVQFPTATASAVHQVIAARGQANAAMIRANGTAAAQMVRAQGSASAQQVRAAAQAAQAPMLAQARAAAQSAATMMRAQASADATAQRAAAAAQAQLIRAQGAYAAQVIRASGAAARSMLSGMAGMVRAVLSPINGAIRGVSGIARSAMGMAGRAAGMGGAFLGLGAGVGAGMFARTARDESIEIESRLANLGRIADVSGKQLDGLGGKLKELARTMPGVKLSDVFDISTIAARMGVGADMLPHFTRDLAKMSTVLEDMPIEVAAERIGRLITVFDKGPQDAIRFASALTALDNASTASADDILNITTRFAGMAKAFNATPAQAMAWATAIRQAGVPLETSGTATQQIISRLASRKDMGRFARIAGMDKDQFRGVLDTNPIEAMQRVLKGLQRVRDTAGPSGLSQTMDKLHLDGQRVRGAFLQMIPVVDELDKYLKIAEGDWESLDSVERGYEVKSKTTRAQLELLANNFKLFAASIGDRLMPIVRKLGDGLTYLFQDIEKYFNGDGGAVVETWANRVGDALHKVAVIWHEWPTFLELGKLTVQEKVGQIQEIFKRLPKFLGNVMRMTGSYLSALFNLLGDKLGIAITKGIFGALVKTLEQMPDGIKRILGVGKEQMAVFRGLSRIRDERPLPKFSDHFTEKGLYQDDQGKDNLPNGLFGKLPDRAFDILAQVQKLINAEGQLAEERRKAAEAAEREAAALRQKPEFIGPPKPPPEFFLGKLTPQRSRVLAQRAMRAQFNAQFRRTQQAGQPRRLSRNPVGRLPAIVNHNLQQAGVLPDLLGNLSRAARADRLRRNSAAVEANRQAIDDAGQVKKFADPALLGKNDKTLEGLKKGIDALSKAFADLQRNGVPLALS